MDGESNDLARPLHVGLFNATEFYRVYPLLETVCVDSIGLTMAIIEEYLRDGSYTMYTDSFAVVITEEIELHHGRVLYFTAAGGQMDQVLALHDRIVQENTERGLTMFMVDGRVGWEPVLKQKGYRKRTVTLTKGF